MTTPPLLAQHKADMERDAAFMMWNALGVFLNSEALRPLQVNDPMAFRQAREAFDRGATAYGWKPS